ncbi:MAG: methyltransferase domain-containing protein [Anaerolineae bacterium]
MLTNDQDIDKALEAQIDPWLTHMRWRADFDEWRKKRLWQENYQQEALADLNRFAKATPIQTRVLDLGAGMGGFAVALARTERQVVAMDYNLAYCEITRTRARRYGLNLPALKGAGEALPFANTAFGILTCWDVVEHVQDPEKLLSEIARVLQPDGRAFITVINRYALVDPHYHLRFINWLPRPLAEKYIGWRQRTKKTPLQDKQKLSEMHYYTYGAAVQLAARFGFETQDLNALHSRFNRLPRPLGRALYLAWRTFGMGTYRLVLIKR